MTLSLQNPPRVSVVMPAYNAEKYIAASVRSVLDQTFSDWELIVVDDGSRDGTAAIARDYVEADARVRCIGQENQGLGSARNRGIESARGELIAFLDSDDLWLPEKLQLQVETMEEERADVVFSGGFIFSDDDAANESNSFHIECGRLEGESFFALLFEANVIPVLSVLVRRDALSRTGLFEEARSYCEDYDLWLRLISDGAVFYGMPRKLVRYRVHQGALSRREVELWRAHLAVLEKWRSHPFFNAPSARRRRQNLIRTLMLALMKENRRREARRCLGALAECGRFSFASMIQRFVLLCLPRFYVPVITALMQFKIRIAEMRGAWRTKRSGA